MSLPTVTREFRNPESKGHKEFKIVETPLAPPKTDEVLVKIHAAALQNTDIGIAAGYYPTKPNVVPLSDCAGEVIAIGDGVTGFKVGDRVSASRCLEHVHGPVTYAVLGSATGFSVDGVLTEYKAFKEHSLVHIPEHLSYEEASTLPCTSVTAWNCLYGPQPIKPGEKLLLLGTGGVAIAAIQLAAPAGVEIFVTSSSDEKLQEAKKLGAHHLINYKTTPNWEDEVLKLTGGQGVDHIIELGGATLQQSFKAAKMNSWIHAVGYMAGPTPKDFSIQGEIIMKSILYRGVFIGPVTAFKAMNNFISHQKIRPIIAKVFPFEEAPQAYDYLAASQHFGKVVIKVSKD